MNQPPADIRKVLSRYGQDHVLTGWEQFDDLTRQSLIEQIRALNFELLQQLFEQQTATYALPDATRVSPLPNILPDEPDSDAQGIGATAISNGELAALVVAGGQGSRLGFDKPKGMFPIGPDSGKTLFL